MVSLSNGSVPPRPPLLLAVIEVHLYFKRVCCVFHTCVIIYVIMVALFYYFFIDNGI